MKTRNGILIGLAAALLAGVAEAATEAALAANPSSSTAAVTVPNGRIGDKVEYTYLSRSTPTASLTETGKWGFGIHGVETVPDDTGISRRALATVQSGGWSDAGGVAKAEWSVHSNSTITSFRDLETGESLGFRVDMKVRNVDHLAVETTDEHGWIRFKPTASSTDPERASVMLRGEYAPFGKTYRVGDDFYREAREDLDWYSYDYYGAMTWSDVEISGVVARLGTLNDLPVIERRYEGCLRVELTPDPWGFGDNQAYILDIEVPADARVCFEVSSWVSSERPYEVLRTTRLDVNDAFHAEVVRFLSAFRPGNQPIPWQMELAGTPYETASPYRPFNPDIARSPSTQHFPSDGPDVRYGYRLSDAIAAAGHDLSLLRFQAWTAAHADAELIGAHLFPTGPDLSGRSWTLVYGTPSGAAFVLTSERASGHPIATNTELGEFDGPVYTKASLPTGPVTLQAADDLYAQYAAFGSSALNQTSFVGDGGSTRTGSNAHGRPAPRCRWESRRARSRI